MKIYVVAAVSDEGGYEVVIAAPTIEIANALRLEAPGPWGAGRDVFEVELVVTLAKWRSRLRWQQAAAYWPLSGPGQLWALEQYRSE